MLSMSTVGALRVQGIAKGSNDRSESKAKRDDHCQVFVWPAVSSGCPVLAAY